MNFYEIIKTKKLGRGFPDYWTQLFSEHVGGKGEWKVAGVLPLTFTAKGGTAADWVIEGNNDVGENLFDIETQIVGEGLDTNGSTVPSQTSNRSDYIAVNAETDYCQYNNVIDTTYRVFQFFDANKEFLSFVAVTVSNKAHVFATPQNCAFCRMSYPKNSTEVMFVKGSTAPDHYIPYQQGVGERTVNLFDKSNGEMKGHFYPGSGNKILSYNSWGSVTIPCEPLTTYTIKKILSTKFYVYTSEDYPATNGYRSDTSNRSDETTVTITSRANDNYLTVSLYAGATDTLTYNEIIDTVVIVEGPTAPTTYIPYGYQIPLTISKQGQPDKTVDIYIGDSPLTEGETVSKASTGVDIELFKGENTVSTTLYNKPTMEIKYIKRR